MIFQNTDNVELTFNYGPAQRDLIESLASDGLVMFSNDAVAIPNENMFQLDDFSRKWLGLPALFQGTARVRLEGAGLLFDESKMLVDYYDEFGNLLSLQADRFFLSGNDGYEYSVQDDLFTCLSLISDFNQLPNKKSNNAGFAKFAQLKEACKHSDRVVLEDLLNNQEAVFPKGVVLDVQIDGERVKINPKIPNEEGFTDQFEKKGNVKDQYTYRSATGTRTRIIFGEGNKSIQDELKNLKNNNTFEGEELKKLVEDPSQFFNPDLVDVSALFGERVLGLQIFVPPAVPVIGKINSEWVPGFKVSEDYIFVTDSYEYQLLKSGYQLALEEEVESVQFKGKQFGLDSVRSVLRVSRLIYEERVSAIEPEGNEVFKEFLIVKDNLEELSFTMNPEQNTVDRYQIHSASKFKSEYQLKNHQVEGIAWLQTAHFELRSPGVLLADDMGLGKTLQILYFIESLADRMKDKTEPVLIVCPSSLMENWLQEYNRFFSNHSYEPVILKGKVQTELKKIRDRTHSGCAPLCITTYETMRMNAVAFCTVNWGCVATDEAQKIKNPTALVTHTAKGLKSTFRIALTGTPVENSLLDLWCLMDFCVPGVLGSAKLFNRNVQSQELDSERIREIIEGRFLRRLKSDVAQDLPEKNEYYVREHFEGEQLEMYLNVLNQLKELKQKDELKGAVVLSAIHEMKSLADHPELVRSDNDLDISSLENSVKIKITLSILEKVKAKGEKVIVFTEKRKMQFILKHLFKERFGLNCDVVNGDVASSSSYGDSKITRQGMVDRFQSVSGFNIIVMSPIAAGFGLNVTEANHVVHYSRHWNPAKEQQATDRVYRIGQIKDVHIYYPIATLPTGELSFDEILDERLRKKKALSDDIMFPSERIEVSADELATQLVG